jgi:hypothetical protein
MKTTRLARRLGLDGNPLRRPTDKIEACLAALTLVAFLAGAPVLSIAAGRAWVTEHFKRRVSAVLLQAAHPVTGLAPARWIAPDGQPLTGRIPVSPGSAAGRTVSLWVNAAGSPTGPPLNRGAVLGREAMAAVFVPIVLGWGLLFLAEAGRWVLDRRRLAGWDAAWAAVGPQWTKRFRPLG